MLDKAMGTWPFMRFLGPNPLEDASSWLTYCSRFQIHHPNDVNEFANRVANIATTYHVAGDCHKLHQSLLKLARKTWPPFSPSLLDSNKSFSCQMTRLFWSTSFEHTLYCLIGPKTPGSLTPRRSRSD